MKEKLMKKKNILSVIAILCIALVFVGISYAYWHFTYIGDKTNIGKSKCLSIELTNQKNEINLTNTYPISDEDGKKLTPYSFTITNTCDTFISYDVNLEMLEGTTMNSKYMAVMINNDKKELLSNLDSTGTVITGSTESRKLASGSLSGEDSVDYTLRLWMDESVTINDDAMNKNFTSKIVVTAQPSNYSPKVAGYDTLHDAILANEYQTTPEQAIEKIQAKGKPDLSKTAPIIKWVEKTGSMTTVNSTKPASTAIKSDDQTSNLTEDDTKIALFTTKTFNSETARYSLSNPVYVDPATIDFSGDIKYYFQTENVAYNQSNKKLYVNRGNSDTTIYQVTGATKTTGTTTWNNVTYDSITYQLSAVTLTEIELETDKSDKGLYHGTDDYGTTYYYRGNVKNNNVYFAGYYWQIVRINGDGSIRLIYNGSTKNATGVKQSINNRTYRFNSKYNDPAYVGYMYGDPDATTFSEVHANTNDSTIKTAIDGWYKTNIVDKGYSQYVSTSVGFCGDRSLYTNNAGDGVQTDKDTIFGTYGRFKAHTAQFTCPEPRDLYTTTDSGVGNKALTYPVGLITYDEMVFAGMDNVRINKLSWIYSTGNFWTMSPSLFSATVGYSGEWIESSDGYLGTWGWTTLDNGARPVINLKSDTLITGGIGTSSDPFVVKTS